ncbi:MAG: radical SAM protein [Candidatus Eisenbacteria sp.]|nr:radical SAM protein [Candidatus Eisenbacteria bacterium]
MRIALGFANQASLAHNNLGFRIAEAILSTRAGIVLERFYLPPSESHLAPGSLRTVPSRVRLSSVALVLISISYEGDAPHVPALLIAGGLPALARRRAAGHPLVVVGGAAVMINPESLAACCDLFLVGEAEALLPTFLDAWEDVRRAPRAVQFDRLEILPGALVPSRREHRLWALGGGLLRSGERLRFEEPGGAPPGRPTPPPPVETVKWMGVAENPSSARLPAEAHFQEDLLLELDRGCPRRCRFCVATRIYGPLRRRDPERLVEHVAGAARAGERIGLLGLSAGDHRGLEALTADLCRRGWRLSISSLPATFARREVADRLIQSGAATLTIAPETGSERLRRIAGKPMTDEAILRSVAMLGAAGLRGLRTYFLIGLPFEEEEDLAAIPVLLGEMRRRLPSRCRLSATVNPFVPKPRTPFQWAPLAPEAYLREAGRRLRRGMPAGVRLRLKSLREARRHTLLTRADARWGERLAQAAETRQPLPAILRAAGEQWEDWTAAVAPAAELPWGYLIDQAEARDLAEEWVRAQRDAGRAG